jgi:hypothetical protein
MGDPVIAEKDEVLTDPRTGLTHRVFEGQPIPGHLLGDQEADAGDEEAPKSGKRTKVQTGPEKEK